MAQLSARCIVGAQEMLSEDQQEWMRGTEDPEASVCSLKERLAEWEGWP